MMTQYDQATILLKRLRNPEFLLGSSESDLRLAATLFGGIARLSDQIGKLFKQRSAELNIARLSSTERHVLGDSYEVLLHNVRAVIKAQSLLFVAPGGLEQGGLIARGSYAASAAKSLGDRAPVRDCNLASIARVAAALLEVYLALPSVFVSKSPLKLRRDIDEAFLLFKVALDL